jgi:Putative Ig domain
MRLSVRVLCALFGLACVASLVVAPPAAAQVAGQNVNMVSGTKWPNGDPFLQRQNEPSMAVSTRNPMHILAGANDYRSVDLEQVLSGGAETGDAWLGLFKSFDGGFTWQSTLLPGCPYAVSQCTDSGALNAGFQAAADPVVRAGTNGMFYYAGLAFDRATSATTASSVSSVFVARYNDLNNNEQLDPITYIDTHIVASGNGSQFLDKPSMAVDIPRPGAGTCSFTANEPGVGPNGGPLAVKQSFPAGNVYLAYTDFLAATKANSTPTHLMFTYSTNCGLTWSTPVQLNTGTTTSQGSAIAVNPVTGAVYVAWRQFASTGVSNAIMVAQSTNAGKTFSAPVQISTFQPFDQGTTETSFRTNAYPALTTDMFGFVYVAFSARGLSASGDARIVAAGSLDGTHWTPAIMVDNPPQSATNPSGRGHQIMPAMTFANGRLTLLYYDLRLDHYAGFYTPNPASLGNYTEMLAPQGELAPTPTTAGLNEVFTPYIDDAGLTLRRHTLDLRVLELGIFPTVTLGPSVLVSQYDYGCCVNPETEDIEQFKFNVPNLPLFDEGQEAFLGDYLDIVPTPMFVPSGSSWTYNFMPSVNPLFHATWTDNRDVVPPPPGGSWENYTAPVVAGAISVENGNPLPACVPGQEGMRNQNIYTSQITGGLVVGAPGNAKPLGTTTYNGKTVPFQRAFPVEAQNSTVSPLNVRFTIPSQPTGGVASFLQFSTLTTLDVTIPPYSSVSRSVFATSTVSTASITVNVAQISAIGGSVVTNGLSSTAVLNPDITNPNITNPNITNPNITNAEVTNPNITNPNITNPNITNAGTENPNITNPNITNTSFLNPNITNPNITNLNVDNVSASNPNITNPDITNPNITNPNITNPNITNPNITNPDITNGSIQDVTYPVTNTGNTTSTYTVKVATNTTVPSGIVLQLLINKLYQTPVAVNCVLGVQTHWITVANITNPMLFTAANPNITNPDITNSTPNEGSVTLAPGETAYITFRVVNPSPSTISFNPLTALTPVTVPQAVNTTTVLANPGNPNLTAPPVYGPLSILTATLPATDRLDAGYSVQLQAAGGKPGANTWSISAGALPPGINLSTSGLVSGTATTPGSYPVTIQVADSATPADVGSISYALSVSVTPLTEQFVMPAPDGIVGQVYSIASPLAVNGGTPPYTWSATGLPAGLGISPTTGQITGTPTVANPNGSPVTVTATDAATPPESLSYTTSIPVGNPIVLTPLTLPAGTIGSPYTYQLTAAGGIGTLVFGPPSPATGVQLSSSGVLTIADPLVSTLTFSVSVHDQAQPTFQSASANYTITFAGQVGTNISFATQPTNSVAGQVLGGSPIVVHVQDNSAAPIAAATVILAFANQPCAAASLGGTNVLQTDANGNASFTNLTIDHGQNGFALLATVVNQTASSNAFNVSGFCATGNLNTARSNHVAVTLPNGNVLVAGGNNSTSPALNTAELYSAGTFTLLTAPMETSRTSFTGTLLGNGSVLVAGGLNAGDNSVNSVETYLNGAFSLDPNAMSTPRDSQTATLLPNGNVLIAGGENGFGNNLNTAEIYHAADGTFSAPITMTSAHVAHTATLFTSGPLQGKVLIVGGDVLGASTNVPTNVAELYDPVANTFTATGPLNVARANHVAVLLPNGKVLVAGGVNTSNQAEPTAEVYDPVAQTFSFTGPLGFAQSSPAAVLLANGQVLVLGGTGTAGQDNQAQMYNPVTGTFSAILGMVSARADFPVVALSDGTLLITGGFNAPSSITNAEIYYPGTGPIQITTTTLPNAPTDTGNPVIQYFEQIQTVGGTGATTFSVISGALPSTISLNPTTGALTSNSTTDPTGTYNFTIQAASAGPPSSTATQAYTLTLVPFFAGATPNQLPTGTEGSAYSQTISSLGGVTPITYQQFNGTMPPGISLNNASPSATLTGTPTAAGTFIFNIQATDSAAPPQSYIEQFTLIIRPQPPTIGVIELNLNEQPVVSWTASPSSDVTGYNVYRSLTSGGPYTLVGSTTAPAQTFTDANAAAGTTYYYVVTAVAGGVESLNSNEMFITVP